MSDAPTAVQLRLTGHMPLEGREAVKLHWQVAPLGTPFTATSVISGTSPDWIDTLTAGVVITQNVAGLSPYTPYHWRVRLLYRPSNRLGQPAGRWVHLPWNGWNEQRFRTLDEPIAGLAATNDSPTLLGSATTLTATVISGTNVTYGWDFGDGTMRPYTYTSGGGLNLPIPDNGCAGGNYLEHTLWVTAEETLLDVDLTVGDIRHAWDDDLDIYLRGPDGTLVALDSNVWNMSRKNSETNGIVPLKK